MIFVLFFFLEKSHKTQILWKTATSAYKTILNFMEIVMQDNIQIGSWEV